MRWVLKSNGVRIDAVRLALLLTLEATGAVSRTCD
jgi:hypothetical protein